MKSSIILSKCVDDRANAIKEVDLNQSYTYLKIPIFLKEILEMGICLYFAENSSENVKTLEFETINVERWDPLKDKLQSLFNFLTERFLEISFIKKETKEVEFPYLDKLDAVSLISGGLDSFCGTLQLIKSNKNFCITHSATVKIMQGLTRGLRKKFFPNLKYYEISSQFNKGELSVSFPQTRSLLFLFNSVPLLELHKADELYIPENGFMLINPPVSGLTKQTKSARPEVTLTIQDIISKYLRREIKVISPFSDKTKSEMIKELPNKNGIFDTRSCFNYRWGKNKNLCGKCYGCNITRLSIEATGIEDKRNYQTDIFQLKTTNSEEKYLFMYLDFLRMCKAFVKKSELTQDTKIWLEKAKNVYGNSVNVDRLVERFGLDMLAGLSNFYNSRKINPGTTFLGTEFLKISSDNEIKQKINERIRELSK